MMFERIPEWWIFLIVASFLALLIYWDYQSGRTQWRIWRMVANVLIILSLLGLYVKPFVVSEAEKIKMALLTKSIIPIDVDSLRKSGYTIVEDFDEYLKIKSIHGVEEMVVLGDGLESWEIDQFTHPFIYIKPQKLPEGPLAVSTNEAVANTRSSITFQVSSIDSLNLHLSGTGIERSKQMIKADEYKATIEITPLISGNLIYELVGLRGGDTLFSEVVPMKVKERAVFNTLILTNTPSFETRFLKNLLKEEGYGVAERIMLSKETFRESFSNLDNRSLRNLSQSLLEEFKVLILDKESHDQLSYNERQNVSDALKKGALGVVWMDNKSNNWCKVKKVSTQKVTLEASQQKVELEKTVSSENYDRQVDIQNQVVGHIHQVGLGKVILPLVSGTYQLQLKGHDQLYSELWNSMLQPIVGAEIKETSIEVPDFPRMDEPTVFSLKADGTTSVYLDSIRIAIQEKWHQPGVFTAMGWPLKRGWNTLKVEGEQRDFFAFDADDWQVQKAQQKREQTAAFVIEDDEAKVQEINVQQPISKWLFFTVFVLAFGFLWVESRLGS